MAMDSEKYPDNCQSCWEGRWDSMRRSARIACLALVCMMISISIPFGRVVAQPIGLRSVQESGLGSVAMKIATVDVHSLPRTDTSSQTAQPLLRHYSPT